MKFLFLRGQASRPKEIAFYSISEDDDMWTQLVYAMTRDMERAVVLYWGGDRKVHYKSNFTVQWTPKMSDYDFGGEPDIIMCRGGFEEYHPILKKYPKAKKVYYGAGKRYKPLRGFTGYDLILVDCEEQREKVMKKFPEIPCELFFKPAADNVFYPRPTQTVWDYCFVAVNPEDERKRVRWVYETLPRNKTLLQLGMTPERKPPANVEVVHAAKCAMPAHMCQCKVGVVPYTEDDSGPRVIPEFLACGVPIVVANSTRFWEAKYSGDSDLFVRRSSKDSFWETAERTDYSAIAKASARAYYESKLSTRHAADYLLKLIERL